MWNLVPHELCAKFSDPPEVRRDTLVTLANLISARRENVGGIGGFEIQLQFLNKDPFRHIPHFLELSGMAPLGRTKLAADFYGPLELAWRLYLAGRCLRLVLLRLLAPGAGRG